MDELVNVLHTVVMRLDEMLAKLGEMHNRLDDTNTNLDKIGDLSRLSEVIILYAAFDKTFFLELLETVCGAAITGTSWNV